MELMLLTDEDKNRLIITANDAIRHRLGVATPPIIPKPAGGDVSNSSLQSDGASFVTLSINNELRGCIGSLEAYRPLSEDVSNNALAAAFSDPRFPSLTLSELEQIHIQISVLSQPETMIFTSEEDLLQQLRPNIDGLILADKSNKATFLPTVWESLSSPEQFLQHLKLKANLAADYWSDSVKVYRYTTECFE